MEKLSHILDHTLSFIRLLFGRGRNPSLVWSVLLTLSLFGVLGVGVKGYLNYFEVIHVNTEDVEARPPLQGMLNPTNITAVLNAYRLKKELLNTLVTDRPLYPEPWQGGPAEGKPQKTTNKSASLLP